MSSKNYRIIDNPAENDAGPTEKMEADGIDDDVCASAVEEECDPDAGGTDHSTIDEANGNDADQPAPETAGGAESASSVESLLEKTIRQRDEYLDMAQRIKAEFENFKRRNQSVRAEAWEDGARETIALMLPVIDNLERALSVSNEKSPLREGLALIHRQMIELLDKRGVSEINRLGEPFEPTLENAVAQADPSEGEPGTVCTVLQKGYKTASRVIRYAMVRVVPGE